MSAGFRIDGVDFLIHANTVALRFAGGDATIIDGLDQLSGSINILTGGRPQGSGVQRRHLPQFISGNRRVSVTAFTNSNPSFASLQERIRPGFSSGTAGWTESRLTRAAGSNVEPARAYYGRTLLRPGKRERDTLRSRTAGRSSFLDDFSSGQGGAGRLAKAWGALAIKPVAVRAPMLFAKRERVIA
jgi:hypothetical protein